MGRPRKDPNDPVSAHPGLFRKPSGVIGFWWVDASGKRRPASAHTKDITKALAVRAKVLEKVRAKVEAGLTGSSTGWDYASRWRNERERLNPANGNFHRKNLAHAQKLLQSMPLEEFRYRHLRTWMKEWVASETHAPRTMLHAYGSLKAMFEDAVREEILDASPCILTGGEHGDLPALEDKDPEWRDTAVFTRAEVLALISDERIPAYRRIYYALIFLTGMRHGEVVNRRWRDYDPTMEPLGQLRLGTAWSREAKKEKPPKNKRSRQIPVHPALASMLAEWRLSGWAQEYGRMPTPDDFIVARPWPRGRDGARVQPVPERLKWHAGKRINDGATWKWLNGQARKSGKRTPGDLAKLGLRARREHDTRRTFISLVVEDGGREVVLRHITHGRPKKSAFDLYPSFTWEAQCDEVKKLRLVRRHKAESSQ
jgi:integrase